ncbi:MAG TPA: DUF3352 domain-containing protein [Thermoleophilaceae bacterium]
MRPLKTLALPLSILALALAGCGGGSSGSSGSPLESGLSYLPKDAPFVVAIDTDVDGSQFENVGKLVDKLPLGGQAVNQLKQQIESSGGGDVSYDEDIKPLLGNPFVVGAVDAKSFTADGGTDDFVGSIQAKDGDKLADVLKKSGAKESGEQSGAKLYEDNGDHFAIKDDTLVVAGSDEQLDAALTRADGDDHLDEDTFDANLDGLPGQALVRTYFDVAGLLASDPDTRDALKVKWVKALRTFGLTASATDSSVDVDFNLKTAEGDLSDEDLPIAAGSDSPGIIDENGQINVGLRDLGQLIRFAENAGQSIDPAGFGQYTQAKDQLDKQLGISIDDDLIAQLTGDVSVNVTVDGSFGVRAELKDPAAFKRTLAKIAPVLPSAAEGAGFGTVGLAKPKAGEDFYALAQPDGDSVVFGVVGDVFVLANDASRAGRLATEQPAKVPGVEGALVVKADAGELVNQLVGAFGGGLGLKGLGARLFSESLGDLTGSIESSTSGLKGSFSLAVK